MSYIIKDVLYAMILQYVQMAMVAGHTCSLGAIVAFEGSLVTLMRG